MLVPDLKWDQKELENLYVLAIALKRGVLSLRELGSEHLPMLRNMLDAGKVSEQGSHTLTVAWNNGHTVDYTCREVLFQRFITVLGDIRQGFIQRGARPGISPPPRILIEKYH